MQRAFEGIQRFWYQNLRVGVRRGGRETRAKDVRDQYDCWKFQSKIELNSFEDWTKEFNFFHLSPEGLGTVCECIMEACPVGYT